MNAIEILMKEHVGAKKAMEEVSKSPLEARKKIFSALKHELEAHDRIEEEIFYPAVKAHPKAGGLGTTDKAAHVAVEKALAELDQLKVEDLTWTPKFNAMRKSLLAHVADEEGRLFVAVREVLSPIELNQLGEKMAAEKVKLLKPLPLAVAGQAQEGL